MNKVIFISCLCLSVNALGIHAIDTEYKNVWKMEYSSIKLYREWIELNYPNERDEDKCRQLFNKYFRDADPIFDNFHPGAFELTDKKTGKKYYDVKLVKFDPYSGEITLAHRNGVMTKNVWDAFDGKFVDVFLPGRDIKLVSGRTLHDAQIVDIRIGVARVIYNIFSDHARVTMIGTMELPDSIRKQFGWIQHQNNKDTTSVIVVHPD